MSAATLPISTPMITLPVASEPRNIAAGRISAVSMISAGPNSTTAAVTMTAIRRLGGPSISSRRYRTIKNPA